MITALDFFVFDEPERNWLDAGYNADGSKPPLMRLEENKTWNSFADNLALPLLEGYGYASGFMEFRALLMGSKVFLDFPMPASKIDYIRDFLNIKKTKNIGILEGEIGNTKILDIAISGEKTGGVPTDRMFKTIKFKAYDPLYD